MRENNDETFLCRAGGERGQHWQSLPISETLGGPGVTHIFYHSLLSLPRFTPVGSYFGEQHLFDARALFVARLQDFIVLGRPADEAYLEWLQTLGLGPTPEHIFVIPDAPEERILLDPPGKPESVEALPPPLRAAASNGARLRLNTYMADEWEWALAERLSALCGATVELAGPTPDCLRRMARKDTGRAIARKAGVPTPPGEIVRIEGVEGPLTHADRAWLERAFRRQRQLTGRAVIHSPYGSSGGGSTLLADDEDGIDIALEWVATKKTRDVILVEPYLPSCVSPNVMIWIDPDTREIRVLGATDQLMGSPLQHVGNTWPCTAYLVDDMLDAARKIGARMAEQGYVGMAGFDFLEYDNPRCGCRDFCFLEINPRFNGSTYLLYALDLLNARQRANHLPEIGAARAHGEKLPPGDFADFQRRFGRFLFDPHSASGVAILNPALLPRGKTLIAYLAPDEEELQRLKRRFSATIKEVGV